MPGKGRVSPGAILITIISVSLALWVYLFLGGSFSFGEAAALATANCILLLLLWRLVAGFIFDSPVGKQNGGQRVLGYRKHFCGDIIPDRRF